MWFEELATVTSARKQYEALLKGKLKVAAESKVRLCKFKPKP